jgi:Asp-tRNA(Asn)/Glu-tRNA(Gln) amidotransferase A subunit family amidase
MLDLATLTLVEAAAGIREGRFTSEQLTLRYLERIRAHEPRIRAWAYLDVDRAVDAARAADRAPRRGPLHGIPIGIKDVIYTKGMPTEMGSPIFKGFVPEYSAACVERLEQAGAFVQGKTVTTELANRHPGLTANPWNPEFTPGGSSSGSAAAVAACFTAATLGTQTRGSVIRPAAFCGVVGFKPSLGVIPTAGVYPQSGTLDHVGTLTRTVEDAGLLAACLSGDDQLAALGDLPEPPRVAAVRTPVWDFADEHQRQLFDANCALLRKVGAKVEDVALGDPFIGADAATRVLQLAEMAHNFRDLLIEHPEKLSPELRGLCARGKSHTAVEYLAARDLREELRKALREIFLGFDAIVTPPATGEAPRSLKSTGDASFCTIWTLCGVPSIVIPTGMGPNDLPMGLQVVCDYPQDRRTLEVAKWCAERVPFEGRLPF